MADNTQLNAGSGGDLIATDDIAGVKYQIVKIGHGLADAAPVHTSAANPLPVSAASLPLPSGAATESTVAGIRTDIGTDGTTPPAVLGAGTGVRGWLRSIYEKLTGTLAVTGTFWQATQPVSAASLPLPAGAATEATLAALNTKVTAVNTGAVVLAAGAAVVGSLAANQSVNAAQIAGVATAVGSGVSGTGVQRVVLATDVILPAVAEIRAATLHVSITAAVNTALTASLPAPAAGLFHYITSVQLVKLYAVLGVASGAGVIITSTNLPGNPAWTTEQSAGLAGTAPTVIDYAPTTPLKASLAATATTFVAPAQLQTIWRWNVSYFTAP